MFGTYPRCDTLNLNLTGDTGGTVAIATDAVLGGLKTHANHDLIACLGLVP
jgi:hypothetical protein